MDRDHGARPVQFYNNPPPRLPPLPPLPVPKHSQEQHSAAPPSIPPAHDSLPHAYTRPPQVISPDFSILLSDRPSRESPHLVILSSDFGDGDERRWPPMNDEMSHLSHGHDKNEMWRRTAGETLAKDLKLNGSDPREDFKYWCLRELPKGYGLFEQVTHPRADGTPHGKGVRLDRFIYGHSTRKIRSALSLGKHLSWLLQGEREPCQCDGCKGVTPGPTTAPAAAAGSVPVPASAREDSAPPPAKKVRPAVAVTARYAESKGKEREDSSATDVAPTPPRLGRPRGGGGARGTRGRGRGRGRGARSVSSTWANPSEEDGVSMGSGSGGESDREKEEESSVPPAEVVPPPKPTNRPATALPLPPPTEVPPASLTQGLISTLDLTPEEAVAEDRLRRENVAYSQYCRVRELVWVRLPLSFGATSKTGLESLLTHWPALIASRHKKEGAEWDQHWQVTYKVNLLGMGDGENHKDREVEEEDVVPWLGYEMISIGEVTSVAGSILSHVEDQNPWSLEDLGAASRLDIVANFLKATQIARWLACIHLRSRAVANLLPSDDPAHPGGSILVSHESIVFGAEIIYRGDVVRILPDAVSSLPAHLLANRTPLARLELPTTLVLLVSDFHRHLPPRGAPHSSTPLQVQGHLYEMVELDNDEEETYELDSLTAHLPVAFPAHRWHSLHSDPSETVEITLDAIAGRYYAVHPELQDTLTRVNVIAESTRKLGLIGEYGIGALGLMLGGMAVGGKVPAMGKMKGISESVLYRREIAEKYGFEQTIRYLQDVVKGVTASDPTGPPVLPPPPATASNGNSGDDAMDVDDSTPTSGAEV